MMLIDEVAELPDVSRATASSRCGPSGIPVQSHVIVKGDAVTGDPIATPSTKKRTFATATLSEAVTVSTMDEPETVEPFEGAMKVTDGEVTSLAAVDSPTATVTWIVEFPRTLFILPTTASENEFRPFIIRLGRISKSWSFYRHLTGFRR